MDNFISASGPAVVLIHGDHSGIAVALGEQSELGGVHIQTVPGREDVTIAACDPDAVLLVLDELPGDQARDVVLALRERRPQLPVIALTSSETPGDRLALLRAGALDCIHKPVDPRELRARVAAHLRLAAAGSGIHRGAIHIDVRRQSVNVAGSELALSQTEYRLLAHFLQTAGTAQTRQEILEAVWYRSEFFTNIVDVYVGYLRRKLADIDAPASITTIRNVGFRFDVHEP